MRREKCINALVSSGINISSMAQFFPHNDIGQHFCSLGTALGPRFFGALNDWYIVQSFHGTGLNNHDAEMFGKKLAKEPWKCQSLPMTTVAICWVTMSTSNFEAEIVCCCTAPGLDFVIHLAE